MLQWLRNLLYGGIDAEFPSTFGIDESVRRLAEGTRRNGLFVFASDPAVGTVTASRVHLQRLRPFFRNDFKPIFDGGFVEAGGRVYLRGIFRMSAYTRFFMSVWLGFCVLWTLMAAVAALLDPISWWFPFAGVGMFALGAGFTAVARHMSRADIGWLSEAIREKL